MRRYVEALSTEVLVDIHREFVAWEAAGALPLESIIRHHVEQADLARNDAMMCTMLAHMAEHVLVARQVPEINRLRDLLASVHDCPIPFTPPPHADGHDYCCGCGRFLGRITGNPTAARWAPIAAAHAAHLDELLYPTAAAE